MTTPRFAFLIYNSNPFYLISACVALFGFQRAQTSLGLADSPQTLAILFAGYSTLMAATAFLIVRFGRVWDDARSIFMVLLLMAFALSISFDHLCISQLETAAIMLVGGLLFSVVISEGLMLGLKMKMPMVYRVPLYIMLSIVFCYPLLFGVCSRWFPDWDTRWLLMLFPLVSAFGLLNLIPAARLGSDSITETGTPWKWPLYPWSLFVLLAIGICGKSYLLCMAFDPTLGQSTIFSPFFLAPVWLAMVILWFEYCAANKPRMIATPMFFGAAGSLLCVVWPISSSAVNYQLFFTDTVASPLWLTMIALLFLYVSAWWRGLDPRGVGVSAILIGCVFAHPDVIGLSSHYFSVWPLVALAGFQLIRSKPKVWSRRVCVASVLLLLGLIVYSRQSPFHQHTLLFSLHGLLATLLVTGVLFHDRFAKQIRLLAVAGVLLMVTAGAVAGSMHWMPIEICFAESAVLGLIGLTSWKIANDRMFGYVSLACVLIGGLPASLRLLFDHAGASTDGTLFFAILAATFCFLLGAGISSLKAGLSNVVQAELSKVWAEVKLRFHPIEFAGKD